MDITDLRDTIVPKSDQLNADQLLGGPMTVTVTQVSRGSGDDQPVVIHYEGDEGRPYKPCKSMRKVLIFAWGEDGTKWVGRSMTLFNKPDVKFGGMQVGGIRISHMSDIRGDLQLALTATKGKKEPFTIKLLDLSSEKKAARGALEAAALLGLAQLQEAWAKLPGIVRRQFGNRCPADLKDQAAAADQKRAEPAPSTGDNAATLGTLNEMAASAQDTQPQKPRDTF